MSSNLLRAKPLALTSLILAMLFALGAATPAFAQGLEQATIRVRAEVIEGLSHRSMATATKNLSWNWDGSMRGLLKKIRRRIGTRTRAHGIVIRYFLTDARGTEVVFRDTKLALRDSSDVRGPNARLPQHPHNDAVGDYALTRNPTGRYFVNMQVTACTI